MKRKNIVGLIAIVAIVAIAMFSGCVEEEATTPTPTSVPTSAPTSTPEITPTPTSTSVPTSVPTSTPEITPTPTPTPIPIPTITPETTKEPEILSSKSYIDDLGYFNVVGEVKNTLSTNINYVKITATFYDAQKKVIGTAFTYTELDILKPNQKSAFELSSYPDMIEPASRKLKVSYKETGNEPFAGLMILSHSAKIGKLGYHDIVGEVQNEGTRKSSFVRVVCTYYDANGEVIGTSFTYTDPNEIDAGDSAPFELSSYPMELRPANYELQVQGK